MLPSHGKINCSECYEVDTNGMAYPHPEWQMINDPGAWGKRQHRLWVKANSSNRGNSVKTDR